MDWIRSWFGGTGGDYRQQVETLPLPVKHKQESPALSTAELLRANEVRRGRLERDIASAHRQAREAHAAGDRKKAMAALQRKRVLEVRLSTLAGKQANLDQIQSAVADAESNAAIAAAMRGGVSQIRAATQAIDVDDVAELADDMQGVMEDMREIDEALSRPIGGDYLYGDPEELEAEMDATFAQWDAEKAGVMSPAAVAELERAAVPPLGQNAGSPGGGGGRGGGTAVAANNRARRRRPVAAGRAGSDRQSHSNI